MISWVLTAIASHILKTLSFNGARVWIKDLTEEGIEPPFPFQN